MARPQELVPGNCYFSVGYYDEELLFPAIMTLKYVRQDTDAPPVWLFEVLEERDDADGGDEAPRLLAVPEDQLYSILDWPMLIAELQAAAVDHPLSAPVSSDVPSLSTELDFGDLDGQVARFVEDPEWQRVTITIAYTDDACSLGRLADGGFEVTTFVKTRIEVEQERRTRALFAELGTSPRQDYLADRGRTRILSFPISDAHDMAILCRRILTEVYAMRGGDTLKYAFLSRSDVERSKDDVSS